MLLPAIGGGLCGLATSAFVWSYVVLINLVGVRDQLLIAATAAPMIVGLISIPFLKLNREYPFQNRASLGLEIVTALLGLKLGAIMTMITTVAVLLGPILLNEGLHLPPLRFEIIVTAILILSFGQGSFFIFGIFVSEKMRQIGLKLKKENA